MRNRAYYHKIKEVLKQPNKTIIKLEDKQVFAWIAIDVDTKECLAV